MPDNLTTKTLHGLKWTYISTIAGAVLQVIFTVVMARLLEPSLFGLVAMANVVLRFASYFSQMGVGPALIQMKYLSAVDIRAAFTSSLILGLLFSLAVWLLAPLSIYVFDNVEVVPVVRLMGLSLFLTGASATATSLLRRNFEFRSLAISEIASFAIGAGLVGISLAYWGAGVWSIVASVLSQGLILAVLSYSFCRHTLSSSFEWKAYKRLYSFGSKLSLIGFIEFLTYYIDSILIGRGLGPRALGIYNRAGLLINLPAQYISTSSSKVLFPSLSIIQSDIERLKEAYISGITFLGVALFSLCFAVSISAPEIVSVLLGDQWIEAIPVLQLVAIAVPFNLMLAFDGLILEATAKLNLKLAVQITHLVFLVTLYGILSRFDLVGFALALLIGEFTFYLVFTFVIMRLVRTTPAEIYSVHAAPFGIGIAIMACAYLGSSALREIALPQWIVLLCQVGISGLVLFVFVVLKPPRRIRFEIFKRFFRDNLSLPTTGLFGSFIRWYRRSLESTN